MTVNVAVYFFGPFHLPFFLNNVFMVEILKRKMTTAIVLQKCSVFVTNGKANTEQDSSTGKIQPTRN